VWEERETMASTGGQQPLPTPTPTPPPPPAVAPTATTTHEIQTRNPNTHLSTSSTNPAQNLPPQPSSLSASANTTTTSSFNGGKKRPLDYGGLLQSSPYFKMRVIVKDLRPLFLEVEFLLFVFWVSLTL